MKVENLEKELIETKNELSQTQEKLNFTTEELEQKKEMLGKFLCIIYF